MTPGVRRGLVAAIGCTLAIRLGLALAVWAARGDVTAFHTADTARYLELGAALARFEGFGTDGRPELFRLPGYPVLVAIAWWLGHATYATLALQAALGAGTAWICFRWASLIAGPRAGLAAAWLFALEPGLWAWSTLVLTETVFVALMALAGLQATVYLRHARRPALLRAVAAACACAYVRLVGYLLPFAIVGAIVVLIARGRSELQGGCRDAAIAILLTMALLGAWHARNGITTGYWGFSTQVERAAFIVGGAVAEAQDGVSYSDAAGKLRRELELQEHRPQSELAAAMRRGGLARIGENPFAFATTYVAGIGATMLHPGPGGVLRLFDSRINDENRSLTQTLIARRFAEARRIAADRGAVYWMVTAVMAGATLLYVGLFAAGAWRGRHSPAVALACAMALAILALSGGPDGDSRRRAPLVPLMCVVAGPLFPGRGARLVQGATEARSGRPARRGA
jgi:hypothetical protein